MKKSRWLAALTLVLLLVPCFYALAQSHPIFLPDFRMSASTTMIQVARNGPPAKYDITITPMNGFRGTIELGCSTKVQNHVLCEVSPSSVTIVDKNLTPKIVVMAKVDSSAPEGMYHVMLKATAPNCAHDMMLSMAMMR